MHEKLIREINGEIADALLARKMPFAPSRKAALALLKVPGWTEGLEQMLPIRGRLECAHVLELCSCVLPRLAPRPEEGWLAFCTQYARERMYPGQGFAPDREEYEAGALFFLTVLQVMLDRERRAVPFDPLKDFQFLSSEEMGEYECGEEYRRFLAAFREEYVYEMMRLSEETTPFRTLGHIAGVHYIAMTVARGIREAGENVDLALVSAAAAAHDLGKFGCRPGERVPLLHYYYTDQWLLGRGMPAVSHIAANHSTWDLELDTLSMESLCLIYADFRSKQGRDEQGRETTILYPLEESFHIILRKLENVDQAKRRRYEFVYGKLHDFEDYMRSLGVDVDLTGQPGARKPPKDPALMPPDETVDSLILLSVEHNLKLMHQLSSERKFGNIIEAARSAKSWQQLRAYLDVFDEYCTYLSVRQKTQALAFLYELLIHREGDIRRQAASLIGKIIAKFHLVYRKEVPADARTDPAEEVPFTLWEEYLDKLIYPDHKTTPQQRGQIGYTLKLVVDALLEYGRSETMPRFIGALLRYYDRPEEKDEDTAFTLLDAIRYLPAQQYDQETRGRLIRFAAWFAASGNLRLQAAALQFLREAQRSLPQDHPQMAQIAAAARSAAGGSLPLLFLRYKVLQRAGEDVSDYQAALYEQDVTSEIFLDNLKSATHWIIKVVGIELLQDQVEHGLREHMLHIATHFSNLVKVSERVGVRHAAGEALVRLIPLLRREQRNEVVVELGKGLEMGQYQISKYIPEYLGRAALFLHPSELDEQVLWLKNLLGSPTNIAVSGALNTVGVLLQHYPAYRGRFPEPERAYEARRQELLGLLLQGLAHYREEVRQEALLVTGTMLFDSPVLSMEEKSRLFSLCYRKLLFLIQAGPRQDPLTFFYRASALAHINLFIALRRLDKGPFAFSQPRKIAFFPGTFDPFTLSHKGIAHAIREMGFEVYLAVDEFSWSKKPQPHMIRRQIVNLSIAGDFHIHLFPNDIPVNLSNPRDLRRLRELFPGQEVYLVVGSDVVGHASAYQAAPVDWSVHSMDHIIFRRAGQPPLPEGKELGITGKVIQLQLPPHLEDISSTRIRENVDMNRDISTFIDPVIQDFIYQNGLYLRDTQDKPLLNARDLSFQWVERPDPLLVADVTAGHRERESLRTAILRDGDQLLVLRHRREGGEPMLGWLSFRYLSTADLYSAFQNADLADQVRLRAGGKTLFITGLYPGNLVLTLSADVIHHRLLRMITQFNQVPQEPTTPRKLGKYMCVPFGKLLRGKTVPNTVTKTIHTDRVYSPDLSESTIEAFPNYASIPCQVRTIKSFDRPVILVDDLMHPGVRIKALDPVLRQEGVDIQLVLVGILSGYGRDLMSQQKRPVDSVYFLPSLRQWFVEATLYPFIGGNTVRRSRPPVPGLLPGINHILPYAVPPFAKECGEEAVFQLSRCCLESARDVIGTLEREYRALYGRNLTLGRLAEAVILPLCPDKGTCLGYDPNLAASVYLENDLEQLLRTHPRG